MNSFVDLVYGSSMKTRYNPERRAWRGRSHKKGGRRVREIRYSQHKD